MIGTHSTSGAIPSKNPSSSPANAAAQLSQIRRIASMSPPASVTND